ncbi:proton-coupled amino acid transporter-like protein CG1139 [Diorhabda carinulata]|uniref:proton-coupled amino acid transporter-like protein CG1139 n=1 Tax=Diorhabda carinulata TaxID=1163345 RepID=UPI0025A19687|nr:proton-coupled amino acid transporter-like protein CG1139 [Diorhabda carinulata]
MVEKKDCFSSTYTVDTFSSTATLNTNEPVKVPIGALPEKEYNQYEHRELEHSNTFTGAFIHLVKSSLGTGILAMPRAFKTAGLAVGFFGTLFIGFLCTHTVHLLVSASQKMCVETKTPSLGYAETAETVFQNGPKKFRRYSRFARNFSDISLALTYAAGTAVYIVFISESLQKLLKEYYEPAGEEVWSIYFKLIILGPLIIFCQVRQLKHLVPFSFIANITMSLAFAITLYYTFKQIPDVKFSERNMVTSLSGIPSFVSTAIFAMEGIGTILPVENSMVTPQFLGCPGVLNLGMLVVVMFFATMGCFGYYSFGDETQATITQNLPQGEVLAQIVQGSISLAVFFTFMLQFYVPTEIIWRKIKPRVQEKNHDIAQIIIRSIIVIIIVAIATAAGHHLDALIDLAGSIFLSTLGFLIPAILDIIINWGNWGKFNYILVKDIMICAFSLFGLVSGTYYALLEFSK